MKRTIQYCWLNEACQKSNCKFFHNRDHRPKYCWREDSCKKIDCKFFHPRDSSGKAESESGESMNVRHEEKSAARGIYGTNDKHESSTPVQIDQATQSRNQSSSAPSPPLHHIQPDSRNAVQKYGGHANLPNNSTVEKSRKHRQSRSGAQQKLDAQSKSIEEVVAVSGLKPLVDNKATRKLSQSESVKVAKTTSNRESNSSRPDRVNKLTSTSVDELTHQRIQSKSKDRQATVDKNVIQSTNFQTSGGQPQETANASRRRCRKYRRTLRCDSESTCEQLQQDVAQRVDCIPKNVAININQRIVQIQPEWNSDECEAINEHRNIIDGIKEQISQIVLSEDYGTNFEKHEVNIQVLREKIIELESHVSIFDSVKSRACRELASKPTELRNQIFRDIYRFKCRLGAFSKRLDMEKYFSSGYRFLIVQGQTGSGKSTQLPQYVADHPRFYGKKIICTQPRKLAAISLSRRVAFEYSGGMDRNDSLSYIGYHVGGDRRAMKSCRIEFVTEGIMLERIMKGDMDSFNNVGCIIIDEAHERSITCDLLLGSFKKPDPRWMDVLIITTSATIDLTLFSEFFMNAPIVQIEGRTFPVDIIYQPVTDASELQLAVSKCALQIHLDCKSLPGDILSFLPGLEDITNAKSMFERELTKIPRTTSGLLDVKVFTLYGKQDPDKQAEVFEKLDSSRKRKIIFATDVAETSITIDGVVYVVDSGVKKEIVFDPERNISSLKINSISKSSAIQRAGRCGRTQPGLCYRLYSQDEFESMNINAAPEVLCKPISLAVLTLLELSVDPGKFDWINPPSKEAMENAEKELIFLGAVDSHRKPTELGNLIAKCQQDPKIMKIVYSGCLKGFGEASCSIASILSVSNTFFWNGNDAESKAKAIQLRKQFAMPEGDVVTMYRIFENFTNTYNSRQTKKSEQCDDITVIRKPASVWCNDNSLNAKSMFAALTTKTELICQLKRMKIWSKFKFQNKVPSNLDVQQLMCSGYFIQCARVFYSKNNNTPVEYFSTESAVAGRLDFRSSLHLLDIEPPPKWIVYDKIVRLPSTIFPIASVMDESWLESTNSDFYKLCLKKIEDLPTELIEKSISQVSFRMIVGRNFCNVDALEKELSCLLTGDADTGKLHLYCAPAKTNDVKERILSKIENALTEIKMQVIEENYRGETRLVIGEGYEIQEILFDKEFTKFYIKNVHENLDKAKLKNMLSQGNERLQSLDCTYHDKTYTAVASFSTKTDAKSAYERLSKFKAFTVTPSYGSGGNGIRHGLNCRLKLTWPTAISKGIANIFFQTAERANHFLDNAHHIFPNAVVHVTGETKRNAEFKLRGLRPNIIQPPLTFVRNQQRGSKFRYDVAAIDRMPNKHQLNYKVTLRGLSLRTDKYELQTTLNVYGFKNIILEYENFVAPDFGNGLTAEEKHVKLGPLRAFMSEDTKTIDFFKRNTGLAGICIFFTSNSVAKEAYNYAKSKYSTLVTDPLLAPHRLEIEFTHTISIQIGLYTFLKTQINELQKNAYDKGMTSVIPTVQDNAKTIIVRFNTTKHSLLAWIQEKLDELVRPTKFNCPHSDVLFSWTGHLELMKFAKKTYINWNDESHIVWVYGNSDVKEKCCNDLERIVTLLSSLDVLDKEMWLNKTVRINGKEGRSINNKCKEVKIDFHHFHGNKMYISGSQQSVNAVVQFLAENKFSWDRSRGKRFKYEETRECGLCYMPPDNTFIMLSVCGHLFCSDCIEAMVKMRPPPFPIKCPVCEEYVALHDIKKLAPAKSLEKVLELAIPTFQRAHSYDIRECPNPGCQQLLCYHQRTTGTNGGEFLFCDQCIATYCIVCSTAMEKPVKSHEEDSCENIQSGVSNLVFKHVRIIQEVVFNLNCPNCKTAFYEFDGCAAVTCGTCSAGFCGLCLQHCGQNAHPHVLSCSKNPGQSYYVDKADLDKAHLDMRNQKLKEYLKCEQLNAKLQQQIIEKIRKDLRDLGMNVPIVSSSEAYDEATTEPSTDILRHVRKIQETILTLNCPNCKTAFFDFDGCAAVTCHSCRMEFCGLCLDFTSNSVRMHVMACQRNSLKGHVFLNANELLKIHVAVRSDKIQSYFDSNLKDTETKSKVLSIIRKDLSDLNIKLPDITARAVRPPVPIQRIVHPQPQQRDFIRQNPQPLPREQVRDYRLPQQREPIRRPAPPPRRECCIL